MKIKKIEGLASMPLDKVRGTNDWYFSARWTGDIYEAEEMLANGQEFEGTILYLIHYPDGKVHMPLDQKKNVYIQRPVWAHDGIAILAVDFDTKEIAIFRFKDDDHSLKCIVKLPLSCVADCYNIHLCTSPLTLYRHGANGDFQLIWPERVSFIVDDNESLVCREGDKLFFSRWYENPDYHEEIYLRSVYTGEIIENFSGILYDMPDGTCWLL